MYSQKTANPFCSSSTCIYRCFYCPYITGAAAEVVGFDGSTLRMRVSLTTVYGEASIHV